MRMNERLPQQIHNVLMASKVYNPLFIYLKDGIYINFGPIKGTNLTKSYSEEPDKVLDYLENILNHDNVPYKTKINTLEVIKDLKNNY
jgi:hypothetical protein